MASADEKLDDMTWWEYVQRHSGGAANTHIAQRVGITPSSVGRWGKGSGPDPVQAAAFARSYGRPVLEAFIAAGYLTPREAGEKPSAAPSLSSLSDDELLGEVERRMKGGQQDGRRPEAEKSADVTPIRRAVDPVQQRAEEELERRRREEGDARTLYDQGRVAAYEVDRDPEDELPDEAQGQRQAGEGNQDSGGGIE